MTLTLPMLKAREALSSLPDRLEASPGTVTVTQHGKPVLAILPWQLFESLVETLEILNDQPTLAALRQGIREADEGQALAWELVRQEL